MVNTRHLFYTLRSYTGPHPHVTLGDGATTCAIKGIGSVEFCTHLGHKIRLHNVLYVPNLNVSLFSIKQHMKYKGCYEHSSHNQCTIAFPSTTITADTNDEIEFSATTPPTDHTVAPSFDEATAILHAPANHNPAITPSLPPHVSSTVTISSPHKSIPVMYPPTRSSSTSVEYILRAPRPLTIKPQARQSFPLGLCFHIPPGLYGRITTSTQPFTSNVEVVTSIINPSTHTEATITLLNHTQLTTTIAKGGTVASIIFERAATPTIQLLSNLQFTQPSSNNVTHPPRSITPPPHNNTTPPDHAPLHPNTIPPDPDSSTESPSPT